MNYKVKIGLEIHLQLATKTKMFCSCKNPSINDLANTCVCPICLAHPGTLPSLNQEALKMALKFGLSLNGEINKKFYFERKNYFYPDLPKGYQISQKRIPLIKNAFLLIGSKKIKIREIHLEEDTAKLYHFNDKSLIDFNRAGVPLLEIVTEPEIESAKEAKEFCQEIQKLARYLEISNADMEKGELRCEVNISLNEITDKNMVIGTRVEIKNLNSFRAVERAIEYEIKRQEKILKEGKKIIQETRGWDEKKQKTIEQRIKEEAEDYRYFPEPDLPIFEINDLEIEEIKKSLPELPFEKRKKFIEKYKFSPLYAKILTEKKENSEFVEKVMEILEKKLNEVLEEEEKEKGKKILAKKVGDWMSKVFGLQTKFGGNFLERITPENFASFLSLFLIERKIQSSKIAYNILEKIYQTKKSVEEIISQEEIEEITDEEKLKEIISLVLENYPEVVSDYKKGKKTAINYLIGQVMKSTKGKASPKIVEKLLKRFLNYNSTL